MRKLLGYYLKAVRLGRGEGPQKSIYSMGQYIWKPLPLQSKSLSLLFTASYLDCSPHKGNWYYIVRTDINPWYFHCVPLKSSLPSLLAANSHRVWGQSGQGAVLVYLTTKTKRKERKGKESAATISSVFVAITFVLLSGLLQPIWGKLLNCFLHQISTKVAGHSSISFPQLQLCWQKKEGMRRKLMWTTG